MTRKYRAQLLLEPAQHAALVEIAEREGRSVSEVAREVIDRGLHDLDRDSAAVWRTRAMALEQLGEIRERAEREHGVYEGDLVAKSRAERQRALDRAQRGDTP